MIQESRVLNCSSPGRTDSHVFVSLLLFELLMLSLPMRNVEWLLVMVVFRILQSHYLGSYSGLLLSLEIMPCMSAKRRVLMAERRGEI